MSPNGKYLLTTPSSKVNMFYPPPWELCWTSRNCRQRCIKLQECKKSLWSKVTLALWQTVNLPDWCFPSFVLDTFTCDPLVSGEQLQFSLCELSEAQDGIFKRGFLHLKTRQHKQNTIRTVCHFCMSPASSTFNPTPTEASQLLSSSNCTPDVFILCIQSAWIQISGFVQWHLQYYMYCKCTRFVTLKKNLTDLFQLIVKMFQRSVLIL